MADESAAEGDAAFLTARKVGDGGVEGGSAEGFGGGLDAEFEVPAVGVVDEVEEVGEFFFGAVALFITSDGLGEVGDAGGDVFEDGEGGVEFEFLREVADPQFAAEGDVAGVGLGLAGEDF